MAKRPFHLAWFISKGYGPKGWRQPWGGTIGPKWVKPDLLVSLAQALERAAFDYVTSHDSPAWEVAFAHAILANAAAARGEERLHAEHYTIARRLGAALEDEDRKVFDATFRAIPAPRSGVTS